MLGTQDGKGKGSRWLIEYPVVHSYVPTSASKSRCHVETTIGRRETSDTCVPGYVSLLFRVVISEVFPVFRETGLHLFSQQHLQLKRNDVTLRAFPPISLLSPATSTVTSPMSYIHSLLSQNNLKKLQYK